MILQDETPLFLAAKEGSYEVAQVLLDHYANRDATDHMDRLPRDIAQERMHHDIVKLLTEYRVNNGNVAMGTSYGGSPSQMVPSFMPPVNGKTRQKSRNRKSSTSKDKPLSPHDQPRSVQLPPAHKPKKKKKASASSSSGSPSMSDVKSPTDPSESPKGMICELPPSYESAVGNGPGGHFSLRLDDGSMMPSDALTNGLSTLDVQNIQQDWIPSMPPPGLPHDPYAVTATTPNHPTTQSSSMQTFLPASTAAAQAVSSVSTIAYSPQSQNHSPHSMTTSPASSHIASVTSPTQSHQLVHSPPHQLVHSPPHQLVHSPPQHQVVPSPPQQIPNSNASQCVTISPMKKNYPTSPTHIQAMHQHMHNRRMPPQQQQQPHLHQPEGMSYTYDYEDVSHTMPLGYVTVPSSNPCDSFVYPSPQSQHSHVSSEPGVTPQHLQQGSDNHYLTPSPSSPGQWSSSSPHSAQSDWSEGISSPPMPVGHGSLPSHVHNSKPDKNGSNGVKSRTDSVYL